MSSLFSRHISSFFLAIRQIDMSLLLGRLHKRYTVLLTYNTLYCLKCCFYLIFQSCAFLFFAIVSSLLGLMIVLLYGISVSTIGIFAIFFPVAKAVSYGMIVLGVIQTIIGLMATVCSCLSCCGSTPPTPVSCCCWLVVVVVVVLVLVKTFRRERRWLLLLIFFAWKWAYHWQFNFYIRIGTSWGCK